MRACPASRSTGTDGILVHVKATKILQCGLWMITEQVSKCRQSPSESHGKGKANGASSWENQNRLWIQEIGDCWLKNETPPGLGGLQALGFVLSSSC